MKKLNSKINTITLQIIISFALPIFLLTLNLYICKSHIYLNYKYQDPAFINQEDCKFKHLERLKYAIITLDYISGKIPIEHLAKLHSKQGDAIFNHRELTHLKDVKKLFYYADILWFISALFIAGVIAGALFIWIKTSKPLYKIFTAAGLIAAFFTISMIISAFYIASDFNNFFIGFHRLFFQQGTWQFNSTDTLISLFPEEFWIDTSLNITAFSMVQGLIIAYVSVIWKLKNTIKKFRLYCLFVSFFIILFIIIFGSIALKEKIYDDINAPCTEIVEIKNNSYCYINLELIRLDYGNTAVKLTCFPADGVFDSYLLCGTYELKLEPCSSIPCIKSQPAELYEYNNNEVKKLGKSRKIEIKDRKLKISIE